MDRDLYSGFVIAEAQRTAGLEPVTPASLPKPSTFTSLRNLLYAFEWWFFGAFAVFIWGRWCADEVTRVRSLSTGSEGTEEEVPSSA